MEVVNISANIYQFVFSNKKREYPLNITALIQDNQAIIIDVAYERHAKKVKAYLENKGISEFIIYLSHHHEDHIDGCKCFDGCKIYGSNLFSQDFQEHLQTDGFLKNFEPNNHITDKQIHSYSNFKIEHLYTPGHNKCSFSFYINNEVLYVGDLIFFNRKGLPSLPYLDANSIIDEYIESMNRIQKLNPKHILFGHGQHISDESEIKKLIKTHTNYLINLKSKKKNSLEDCLEGDITSYCGVNFHSSNLLKITG